MVSNYPEHFYRAILGQNRETRGCISAEGRAKSVPDDCFICRSPPKQVKGTENRVLGGCFVLFHNKSIPLSLSKFNWCFLSTQTTPLTIRKAENTRQSCKVLIRPGSLPKTYFNPIYKGMNCSLCLFTRKSEYMVTMTPSNLITQIQCLS